MSISFKSKTNFFTSRKSTSALAKSVETPPESSVAVAIIVATIAESAMVTSREEERPVNKNVRLDRVEVILDTEVIDDHGCSPEKIRGKDFLLPLGYESVQGCYSLQHDMGFWRIRLCYWHILANSECLLIEEFSLVLPNALDKEFDEPRVIF